MSRTGISGKMFMQGCFDQEQAGSKEIRICRIATQVYQKQHCGRSSRLLPAFRPSRRAEAGQMDFQQAARQNSEDSSSKAVEETIKEVESYLGDSRAGMALRQLLSQHA
ncbi:MAG: hypothetical protein MZV63_12785 [Marinilabiliales bacterium]|nr:hypothetical protein [Marinilabiliales bacterium]